MAKCTDRSVGQGSNLSCPTEVGSGKNDPFFCTSNSMDNDFIVCDQPHKVKYAMVRVYTNTIVHCIHNALRCIQHPAVV